MKAGHDGAHTLELSVHSTHTIDLVVMFDYNLSNHWADDEPVWVQALVSSLYRRREDDGTVLPLPIVVDEILDWVNLASGEDAWVKKQNRASLAADLNQSLEAVGPALARVIATPLNAFAAAFAQLDASPKPVLRQPPGNRTATSWTAVLDAGADLLTCLGSDAAAGACWDDLVAISQDRTITTNRHRPVADLLHAQLARRGLDADGAFSRIARMVAYAESDDMSDAVPLPPAEKRVASARAIAVTPADTHTVVVWLGYRGRIDARLDAGRVTFYDAHWAVPNATSSGQAFDHKDELTELVGSANMFKVAERVDEESDVDTLVRVDLGRTHSARASDRALAIVDSIFNVALHFGGGIRPHLAQYAVVLDGRSSFFGYRGADRNAVMTDDHYGAGLTSEAVDEHGPKIADALAREELPMFLAAAIEVQTASDRPFSRDLLLRRPSTADIASVVPLSDRVVQHVAAHAAVPPSVAFDVLGKKWPHVRWLGSVQYAVHLCLISGGTSSALRDELTREWYNPTKPSAVFVADRTVDLLRVCRIESERSWTERVLASVDDYRLYAEFIEEYKQEQRVIEARRTRVRNALVHGNPVHFQVVTSVRPYSEFLSSNALHAGIEAYVSSSDPSIVLARTSADYDVMQSGVSCADYWRAQLPRTSTQ